MIDEIKFGTDDLRGVIGEDFIFADVRRVIEAIDSYVKKEGEPEKGLVVGYDNRFPSLECARLASEAIAQAGIPVVPADQSIPTPAEGYAQWPGGPSVSS